MSPELSKLGLIQKQFNMKCISLHEFMEEPGDYRRLFDSIPELTDLIPRHIDRFLIFS